MKNTTETNLAVIANDISYIKERIEAIEKKLEADYVNRQEFLPVKNLVYGLVSLVLVAVFTALVALVIARPAKAVDLMRGKLSFYGKFAK